VICGEFDPSDPYPKPWVRVLVSLDGISPIWREVRFLLGTGAARTCLHPRDALALGVPRRSLLGRSTRVKPPIILTSVGGTTEYYGTPATYAFETTTGNLHVVHREILVAKATQTNAALPALLGWDLLQDFHLTIHQDTGSIELEPLAPNILRVPGTP
jgi:hypothetical protein